MALDGSCLDVADEQANAQFFGYPAAVRGQRLPAGACAGLVECGTHAVVAAELRPRAQREGDGRPSAARLARKDMLVLADRGFYSFKLWQWPAQRGHAAVARECHLKLAVEQVLADGSYLSTVYDSADSARRWPTVRVIEYALQDSATPAKDSYRLITTMLDRSAPGLELAALYHERWEIEGVFDEFKTHLRAASTVLRSKTPDLVQQELWGLLLAHFAVRQLMAQAAWQRGLDPDRLSFMHAVRVIKRKMPQAAAVPP